MHIGAMPTGRPSGRDPCLPTAVTGVSRDRSGCWKEGLLSTAIGRQRMTVRQFLWKQLGEALRERDYSLTSSSG
jgi:hypothetical protein